MTEIPSTWVLARLSEVCETTSGGTPSRSRADFYGGSIPWLKSGELNDGLVTSIEETITEEGLRSSSAKLFPEGTVLIALYGATVGRLGILGLPASTNQAVCGMFPSEALDRSFLFYHLLARRDELVEASFGGAQRNISQRIIRELIVPIAPLDEQGRIVAEIEKHLTRLDAAVHTLKRARVRLRRFRSVLLDLAFASCSTSPVRHIGDLGHLVGGITKGQRRKPGTAMRSVPYLRVANVQRGVLALDDIRTIEATEEEISALRLIPGDVLLNEGGDRDKLGRGWIWEGQLAECIHQNHVFRIRLNPDLATPKFVSYYANHHGAQYFFDEGKQTTNLASINMTKLRALPIPLPTIGTQEKIVEQLEDRLSLVDDLNRRISSSLLRAGQLRRSILRKAFEGQLVPQDPAEEPASAMIQRASANLSNQHLEKTPERGEFDMGKSGAPERRGLLDTLRIAAEPLSPEQLLVNAGHTVESIEDFYAELKREVDQGAVREVRTSTSHVVLQAVTR